MFVQLRKQSDESGVILIIVLIILLVMATFSVGIFSQSMSQTKTSRSQVDEIVAEQLAKGIFWKMYNSEQAGGALSSAPSSMTLNGRNYVFTPTVSVSGAYQAVSINVDY